MLIRENSEKFTLIMNLAPARTGPASVMRNYEFIWSGLIALNNSLNTIHTCYSSETWFNNDLQQYNNHVLR